MLDNELEKNLNDAFKLAYKKKHEFVTVEHLFLSLLENKEAVNVLNYFGADLKGLKGNLESFISKTTPRVNEEEEQEIKPTLGFQRVLQRAVFHVQSSGKKEVNGANLLVAIFSEKESQSVYLLEQEGITRLDIVSYISHGNKEEVFNSPSRNRQESLIDGLYGDGRTGHIYAGKSIDHVTAIRSVKEIVKELVKEL